MTGTHAIDALLAMRRLMREASLESEPEAAIWHVTRALPSLVGSRRPNPEIPRESAATTFMLTPDARHHLIVAPVNFQPEQWHERVEVTLGHPDYVRRTCGPLLLRETAHHQSFVKILQTFRARSAMFAPLMWRGAYVGTLICASSVPETFSESDLTVHEAVAAALTALWVAQGGLEWMRSLDYDSLPERVAGPDGSSVVAVPGARG